MVANITNGKIMKEKICLNCKHFYIMRCTNDDMDYSRCMYNDANEYTDYDLTCSNFEQM